MEYIRSNILCLDPTFFRGVTRAFDLFGSCVSLYNLSVNPVELDKAGFAADRAALAHDARAAINQVVPMLRKELASKENSELALK